jgi:hypothetical protein
MKTRAMLQIFWRGLDASFVPKWLGGSFMETHLLQDYTRNATGCWGSNLVENENSI